MKRCTASDDSLRAGGGIHQSPKRVLVIEDDAELSMVLENGLTEKGFAVQVEATYDTGASHAALGGADVIVLDVQLPGGNGFDLCRAIRAQGIRTPVLMLTARDTVDDRVQGLNAGADDYLTKPFAFRELLARLSAIARRGSILLPETIDVADLHVDVRRRHVRRSGRNIELTAKEFALLEFFVRHHDQVVDRAILLDYVWSEQQNPLTNLIDVLVLRLRRKIDVGFDPPLVHTVRGAGYRFGL